MSLEMKYEEQEALIQHNRFEEAFKVLNEMQINGEYIVDIQNTIRRKHKMEFTMRNGNGEVIFMLTDKETLKTKKYRV